MPNSFRSNSPRAGPTPFRYSIGVSNRLFCIAKLKHEYKPLIENYKMRAELVCLALGLSLDYADFILKQDFG